MNWGHCIVYDRADRELWRIDLRFREHFPPDLVPRAMRDPNVASFHIGTRRWYAPWSWKCSTAVAPENWPRRLIAG
jgi:hypothetical protein